MNERPKLAKVAAIAMVLCSVLAAISAFGQTPYTAVWTGAGDGIYFYSNANWSDGILPNANNGDTAEWNGLTTSNLFIITDASMLGGLQIGGLNLHSTANQTNSINIDTVLGTSQGFPVFNVTIDAHAGAFSFGGTNPAHLFYMPQRPSGVTHIYHNDSANAGLLNPYILYKAGGGSTYIMDFQGAGNWAVNNYLQCDNGASMAVQVDGPGATTWTPQGYFGADPIKGVNITGGTLVLAAPHLKLNTASITNNGTFIFNAPLQAQVLAGTISGAGIVMVAGGTLTLTGANSYTGNTILSGGELIADSAETGTNGPLGAGGTISFTGGTLGFGVANAFDYSPRFDTSAGQAYSIDTGGQFVSFASPLRSSGASLTKLGEGTLTLAGVNNYSGLTLVNAGKLVFQGAKAGSGDIAVSDSSTLGVFADGAPVTAGTLTVGTNSGATLEFNNVNSTTKPLIVVNTLSSAGTVTININSGTVGAALSYPLLAWTNGAAPLVSPGVLIGCTDSLSIVGNVLYLNVASAAAPTLNFTPNGNSLQLSWSGCFKLQAQTNSLTSANWADYPGGDTSPVTVTIDPVNGSVFFRLVSTP